jgi:signal transduction histidine kinase
VRTMHQATATIWRGPRFLHWNQDLADAVMAIAIMAAGFASAFQDHAQFDAVSVSLLVLQSLPIAWRRRNPLRILVVTGLAITLYSVCGYPESGAQFGVFVAFYTVAANEPRRRATVAALLTAGGIFVSFAAEATVYSISDATGSLTSTYIFYGLAWLIGDNLRVRRAYTRELENRAARLDQDREEMASQAVTEERARIARELHDVVAHYVSVMVVQAAGARRIVDKDPDAAKGAIEAVETAGRTALAEMRRMLEVLRADDPGTGPQPGLGEVERLVETVREAGLPVELSIKGTACCLPAGMDLAAYRIVQEALTNTVKHGGKASARVSITYADEYVEIEAVDDGRGAAAQILTSTPSGGHGLIGMKERVALFGGVLEAGPVLTGGYRVYARLPLESEDVARARSQREATLAAQGWGDGSHARPGPDRHRAPHEPAPTRRSLPPLMVRVLPPHPGEQHPHSRRERGEL